MLLITGNMPWPARAETAAWLITSVVIILTVMNGSRFAAALLLKLYEIFIAYNTAGLV